MDSDEERHLSHSQNKQYTALRSDLSAALTAFDRAQDWADLIHDLQRVNRVLNKHSNSTFLPEKPLLAKRLAQCLTSFLPSGVHLKALETYHLVFKRIGPARLARDLPLYAGGLFPLFSHCSTSLKAPLLSLYETHFLPLGAALCPVLDGFVLAVLPGVEDESSEFYARSRTLLDRLLSAVGDIGVFARSLWRALLLSPPMRLSTAHYLRSMLAAGDEELRSEMVADMPLAAYAITAALSDNNALTQRGVLDLLLGELALDSPFFQSTGLEERDAAVAVVGGVFGTLIRRDMSLTKRVHAWLLGGKESSEGINFCTEYSNDLVLAAIDNEFSVLLAGLGGKNAAFATRPCRIAAALMDRAELAKCLGPHFALRILQYGRDAIAKNDHEHERDIRHAISDVLQDLGSDSVFAELERMLAGGKEKNHEDFELLTFALSMFPTKNEVVRKKHLPALLRVAVKSLSAVSADNLTLDKAVAFCSKALVAMRLSRSGPVADSESANVGDSVSSFASFFVAWLAHEVQTAPAELRRSYANVSAVDEHASELRMAAVFESRLECISLAKSACTFFVTAAASGIGGAETLRVSLQATAKCACAADVRISIAGARAFADVFASASSKLVWDEGDDEQIMGVIRRCWRQLHPSLRTATPQSAQALLGLQKRFPEETKIVVADGILSTDPSRRLRNLERFACLWQLAVEHRLFPLPSDNGLFLMLDALTDEEWAPKMLARSWLSDALEVDAASVLDAPLRLLLTSAAKVAGPQHEFQAVYDAPRALYGFQVLRGILETCSTIVRSHREQGYGLQSPSQRSRRGGKRGRTGVRALAAASPSARTAQALSNVFGLSPDGHVTTQNEALNVSSSAEGPVRLSHLLPAHNYIVAVALTCLGYLRGRVPPRFALRENSPNNTDRWATGECNTSVSSLGVESDDYLWLMAGLGFKSFTELHAGVCAASAECLATLFTTIPIPSQMSASLSSLFTDPILTLASVCIDSSDAVLQLHFLNSIAFLVTADGPCFLSSVEGKGAFMKNDSSGHRASHSEGQKEVHNLKRAEQYSRGVQVSPIETMSSFVPWLLDGVSSSCQTSHIEHESGSHEVLGVRRRWIQFTESVMQHVGVTLPIVTEGLLLILLRLLTVQTTGETSPRYAGDSQFSRVDEALTLLEGIAVVTSIVLWSFEHALSTGELRDDAMSGLSPTPDGAFRSNTLPHSNKPVDLDNSEHHATTTPGSARTSEYSNLSQNGDVAPLVQEERTSNVSTATAAVINAINPLRMINDFVKDVLGASGSEGTQRMFDPRRSSSRLLFCLFPVLLRHIALVWGPISENYSLRHVDGSVREDVPPRLSTELPRERRQAQRMSALSIVEPLYELRPTDVIAGVIALFSEEQDEFGYIDESRKGTSIAQAACHVLHAIDDVTPEAIVSAVKTITEKTVKWDPSSVEAKEGRLQASLRQKSNAVIISIIQNGAKSVTEEDIRAIGRIAPSENSASLPGGTVGLQLVQGVYSSSASTGSSHQDLFHWGDFFATYPPGRVETGCFNFLLFYFSSCRDSNMLQGCFPALHVLLKETLGTARRKSTIPALLKVLGSFISRIPSPYPDRRHRRDLMSIAASIVGSCSTIASAAADIPSEEMNGVAKDFKRHLSVVALRALATTVPLLIDSGFLEDKPQLSSTVSICLAPAVTALKKAASRASSIQAALYSSKRTRGSVEHQSEKSRIETTLDILTSKAATEVLLQISSRDWGVKFARRELLTLIEDPNFFFGKEAGVLEKTSAIVKEVVAGGGAAALLTAIGSSASNVTPGISLFSGRDSETVLRARAIRRVAFCVFVSEPDFYSPQLPSVLERLRDALRMSDPGLVVECLLCLRALLLRIGPAAISAFRATTLSEMFRIASNPTDDLNATVAALKFLDLTTLLSPADYGYERCFFFGEQVLPDVVPRSDMKQFKPLALNLSSLWTSESKTEKDIFMPPFRLERGRTVFPGNPPKGFDEQFVGRYAAALIARNSLPKMRAITVDKEEICREFEQEFLR